MALHRRYEAGLFRARRSLERLERDVRIEGAITRFGGLAIAREVERTVEKRENHWRCGVSGNRRRIRSRDRESQQLATEQVDVVDDVPPLLRRQRRSEPRHRRAAHSNRDDIVGKRRCELGSEFSDAGRGRRRAQRVRGRPVTGPRHAVTRRAALDEQRVPLGRIERALWKIHRPGRPERRGKMLMKLSYYCRRFSLRDRGNNAVEDRPRRHGIVAAKPGCDLFGVGQEPVSLVELILRDEFSVLVNRLRVLLGGDTDDARKTFCRIFLGGQRNGCDERQDRDTDPSQKSMIHCRVNLSGFVVEAIVGARAPTSI